MLQDDLQIVSGTEYPLVKQRAFFHEVLVQRNSADMMAYREKNWRSLITGTV